MKLLASVALFASWAAAPVCAAQMTITVEPSAKNFAAPSNLAPNDLKLSARSARLPVLGLDRLPADQSDVQLFIVLDDSTRSGALSVQLPELKRWVEGLPAGEQVAVGYIRNGAVNLAEAFTTDHAKAAGALRLPEAIAGVNGSPYFAIDSVARHWPATNPGARRALLLFTDGVDRYYTDPRIIDDPYVDGAVDSALKSHIAVYTVYLRGEGSYGTTDWQITMAQSRLLQVSRETGGFAYQDTLSNPVSIAPYLSDFSLRLANQYRVTFQAANRQGFQPVTLKTELPHVKIAAPARVYVQ
ncbi:MAG TPA: hypothetical protein VMU19_01880 [Bryobacteraceae bacterium]|nr:hypothetical protein [Bryobacteraceae bacterium]